MRLIIAGCRDLLPDEEHSSFKSELARRLLELEEAIKAVRESYVISEVVSGGAPGADYLGEVWAVKNGVNLHRIEAEWKKYGRRAGPLRNKRMAEYAGKEPEGGLLALWDGESPGTRNMIETAEKLGLYILIKYVEVQRGNLRATEHVDDQAARDRELAEVSRRSLPPM